MVRVSCFLFFCISLILLSAKDSHAQSIYAGGNGDGFSVNSFAQPDNILFNIYSGGSNDGFASNSFAQPANILFDIYKGGTDDGFSTSSFAQADNILFDIYKGGIEDGFSTGSFAQADNILFDIYKGGIADGFSITSFAQADNVLFDIYRGGAGDGFSFSRLGAIGTEVPLPIELVSFEGRYQMGVVFLVWKTASELNNERFVLERSINGIEFIPLYSVDGSGTTFLPREYKYTDQKPMPGVNYYRLKQIDFDQAFTLSKIIAVEADDQPSPAIVIFPNPSGQMDGVQILLKGVVSGTPALVRIMNANSQHIHAFATTVDEFGRIQIESQITSRIAAGFYLVSVQLSTGMRVVKWIVK